MTSHSANLEEEDEKGDEGERVSTYLVGNIFQEYALVALNQYVIETTGHYKSWRA